MNILLRHTLRSLKKNRLQATVIAVTVIIVTALLFVAFSVTDIFYSIASNEYARIGVDSDVMVGRLGDTETFARGTVDNALKDDPNVEYVRYFLRMGTVIRTENDNMMVFLEATDVDGFVKPANGFSLVSSAERDGYPRALVSQSFIKNNGLETGSLIRILSPIVNQYVTFRITHVFADSGFFSSTTMQNVLVDISEIGSYGLVNNALIKLKDNSSIDGYVDKLTEALPVSYVGSAFPEEYIESLVSQNSALFSLGIVFVAVIMILILFTGYLIIARNRTNEMSIMKTAGATPLQTAALMLSEAAIYGVIGALIGLIVGRIVIEALLAAFLPYAVSLINYSFVKYALSFILGALTSVIAAIIPILKVAGKSVRELTETGEKHTRRAPLWVVLIIGIITAALAAAVPLTPQEVSIRLFVAAVPAMLAFAVTVSPYILKGTAAVFKKAIPSKAARVASGAAQRNGSLSLLSALLAIVVVFSFLFTGVMETVAKGITPNAARFAGDAVITAGVQKFGDSLSDAEYLSETDGVEAVTVLSSYTANAVVNGKDVNYKLSVYGLKGSEDIKRVLGGMDYDRYATFGAMAHPIILNYDFANRMNVNAGDKIKLYREIKTSTDELQTFLDAEFTVCGFEYSETEYNAVAYIKGADFTENGKPFAGLAAKFIVSFDKTADFQTAFSALRSRAEALGEDYVTLSYSSWVYSSGLNVSGVISFIRVIEVFFILMAALGIINVATVTVLDRKRELYLYKIYGMTFGDYLSFSAAEGAITGIAGAVTGFFAGLVAAVSMPTLLAVIDKYYFIHALPYQLPAAAIGGAALFTLLSAVIALFNKNRFVTKRYGTERR